MHKLQNTRTRRGVLLLIALAVLAMFGLLALSFVLIAAHYQRTAAISARAAQVPDTPEEELDEAFRQVVRGTNNLASVLGPHSLLEDMYGNDSRIAAVPGVANTTGICGGQLIQVPVYSPSPPPDTTLLALSASPQRPGASCSGCVITFLNGPRTKGQSTRIVSYLPANPPTLVNDCFQIVATEGVTYANIVADLGDVSEPFTDDNGNGVHDSGESFTDTNGNGVCDTLYYAINGVPFGGTGFGYDTTTATLGLSFDGTFGSGPCALLPNAATVPQVSGTYVDPTAGGANEDYDAVDYQNMPLAMVTSSGSVPIPSLHRPELIRYWMNATSKPDFNNLDDDLKRLIMLRPLPTPAFTGGNPSFSATWDGVSPGYSWDVDNNGDGIPDSIWVDLGMPVRSARDGRLYKPLFAVLCTDLDGRFNVNAHGSLAQTEEEPYYKKVNVDFSATDAHPYFTPPVNVDLAFSSTYDSVNKWYDPYIYLPRGFGWGPAEVNLRSLFSNLTDYQNLLKTRYQSRLSTDTSYWPGESLNDDPLSHNMWSEYGGTYWNFSTPNSAGAYGSPPDPKGSAVIGLDTTGHPLYCALGVDEQTDDPYEMNLSPQAVTDSPFTAAELEAVLRPYDMDLSTLPKRLADLISAAGRHSVTTESWDLPCPALAVPLELRNALGDKRLHHVTDLLQAKGVPANLYRDLWPPEMLAGLRMDLNRPFGNGRDGSTPADNVIDDTGEVSTEKIVQYDSSGAEIPVASAVAFSHTNGSGVSATLARQLYARHLYVLMLTLIDYPATPTTPDQLNKAKLIAQFAVNVVDFRDRDAIMTPFEYDPAPLDSDGWTASTGDVVWGCERPELLLTETFAMHDRRTEDLDTDDGDAAVIGPGTDDDNDFDQRFRPEQSLFVEVYNPNTPLEPLPAEICNGTDGTDTTMGVDLAKIASDGSPVWRLGIVTPDEATKNPDDPSTPVTYDRTVYFVDEDTVATLPADGATVQQRPMKGLSATTLPIRPGHYAVIGPGKPGETTTSTTYLGYETDGTQDITSTRRIELDPDADTVSFYSAGGSTKDVTTLSVSYVPNAVPVIINEPVRLSLTTTAGSYPPADSNNIAYNAATGYQTPYDQPRDALNTPDLWNGTAPGMDGTGFKDNGVIKKFRVIHLQRLANPLEPYNASTNPYRTVDSMVVDLHTLNGKKLQTVKDLDETGALSAVVSRQRGETTAGTAMNNIWTQEPFSGDTSPQPYGPGISANNHYIDVPFHHTFVYLNAPFGTPRTWPAGDPPKPFPWLTWPNRPFVSQYELLLVPAASSRHLLMNGADVDATDNPFSMTFSFGSSPATADAFDQPKQPFAHLLNFCLSTTFGGSSMEAALPTNLARLLDFVHVPSRFVGTTLQANANTFATAATDHAFHPPFHHIPLYREPGRVNLNTIFNPDVWAGLMNYFPDMYTSRTPPMFWNEFVDSRRGYDYGTGYQTDINADYPTRFANPFRSTGGASFVPTWGSSSTLGLAGMADPADVVRHDVNATILRQEIPGPSGNRPLLQFDSDSANVTKVTPQADGQPLISDLNNPNYNPYFTYQVMNRLGNLVTTRSNVYAIWITVGYFEVTPDTSAPGGYAFGQELGTDTGQIKRHRAFFIFDRSIPVGFQRGENLNVDKAVLLRRIIE